MTFSELISKYLKENELSYRDFAKRCNVSPGYISMLVNNRNPKTGLPPTPSINVYKGCAKGMGLTLDEMFRMIDDAPVAIEGKAQADDDVWRLREELRDDPDRRALLNLARNGSAKDVRQVAALIDALRATNPEFYDGDEPS